ncbi:MAG: cyclic nucleotide-binding domain-containing protein [Myxococcota bacterium]
MTEHRYRPGDYLMHEGEPATHLYFVLRGSVEIRKHGRVLRQLSDRSVVGGISVLAEDPEGYDVIALSNTIALSLSADDGWDTFEDHFQLVHGVITRICGEMLTMRQELPGFGFKETTWEYGPPPPPPMDLVGRMAALRQAIPFAGSHVEALADLARDVQELRYDEAQPLWAAGDPSDHFLFIRHGTVCGVTEKGAIRLGPGDTVGSLGSLSRKPRWFDAKTEGPFVALKVDREAWSDLLEDHFHVAKRMVTAVSKGMLELMERIAESKDKDEAAA